MYEKLLDELETISKALGQSDGDYLNADGEDDEEEAARIRMAAKAKGGDGDGDEDDEYDEGEDLSLGKSFRVKMPDGEEADVLDGTQVVARLGKSLQKTQAGIAKALQAATQVMGDLQAAVVKRDAAIAEQGELIKSLTETVGRLGDAGRGRKAVVSVSEKDGGSDLNKSAGITPVEFMGKAKAAFEAGKLTGGELMRVEAHINRGLQPPADIVSRVAAA
jgi:hypothetical protein